MAKTGYLNARIDPGLKEKAESIFSALGVSSSQAITMFYRQVVLRRGLPFDVRIPNADTVEALLEAEAGDGETLTESTEAAFDEILRRDDDRRG